MASPLQALVRWRLTRAILCIPIEDSFADFGFLKFNERAISRKVHNLLYTDYLEFVWPPVQVTVAKRGSFKTLS